jgi:hypothetical protein
VTGVKGLCLKYDLIILNLLLLEFYYKLSHNLMAKINLIILKDYGLLDSNTFSLQKYQFLYEVQQKNSHLKLHIFYTSLPFFYEEE